MLSFMGGGNPFARDPEQVLTDQVQAQQAQQAPDPATTGAIPAQAPAVAPPAAPSRGFGEIIGDAISGRGIMGAQPGDDQIDPTTGAPKGMVRAQGMQSMMKMGLLFLAAGQNMSNDARAAILSKAPSLVGGGDEALSSFAQTRLQMAKLKLEERKALSEEQAAKDTASALDRLSGGGMGAAPSAGTAAVQSAQAGNAATGQAIGVPEAAVAAPGASAGPVAAGGGLAGATATVPGPMAPGGVPRGPMISPERALAIKAQPTTAGKAQELAKAVSDAEGRESEGQARWNKFTGRLEYPKIRNGVEIGVREGGAPQATVEDVPGPDGSTYREKVVRAPDGSRVVIERQDVRDPRADQLQKLDIDVARGDRDVFMKTYRETARPAVESYKKLATLREKVLEGEAVTGTGANYQRAVMNALASAGYLSKEGVAKLTTSADIERALAGSVATFIKDFNGNQNVSDRDVAYAKEIMQASLSNNKELVASAIGNAMNSNKSAIKNYQEDSVRHNTSVPADRLKVPTVDIDIDKEEAGHQDRIMKAQEAKIAAEEAKKGKPRAPGAAAVVPAQSAPAENAPPVRYERRDGKIVRVQ